MWLRNRDLQRSGLPAGWARAAADFGDVVARYAEEIGSMRDDRFAPGGDGACDHGFTPANGAPSRPAVR